MINEPFWYDFSEYPTDAECFKRLNIPAETIDTLKSCNRKVYGKWKCETNSMIITRYVCLKCKSYGIEIQGSCDKCEITTMELTSKIKNKGVCRIINERFLAFQDFVDYLDSAANVHLPRKLRINQNTIRSKHCQLYTINQQKIALSSFDLKRIVLEDNIHTLPLGHYSHR